MGTRAGGARFERMKASACWAGDLFQNVHPVLPNQQVGTVAAGRIGLRALRLLRPFDVKLHYMDRHRLPDAVEKELNLTYHTTLESLAKVCDVVTLNCPLHPETAHMINAKSLKNFKRGAY